MRHIVEVDCDRGLLQELDAFDSDLVVLAKLFSIKFWDTGADELEDAVFLAGLVLLACYDLLQIHRFFLEFETEIPLHQ